MERPDEATRTASIYATATGDDVGPSAEADAFADVLRVALDLTSAKLVWLMMLGRDGGMARVAASMDAGGEAGRVLPPGVARALWGVPKTGAFQVPLHPDGVPSIAGASAVTAHGESLAIVCELPLHRDIPQRTMNTLTALARTAALAIHSGECSNPLPDPARALMQAILDAVPDHIWIKDLAGRYLIVNKAAATAFGLGSPAETVGGTAWDVFTPERAAITEAEDRQVLEGGETLFDTLHLGQLSHPHRWWLTNKLPLHDGDGQITGLVGISRDVTEIVATRAELRRERDRLQQIIDAIPDAIVVKGRDGRVELHNLEAARQLAVKLERPLTGAMVPDYLSGSRLERVLARDRQVFASGQAVVNALDTIEIDGVERWQLV
ncbi:MAG: PAS domain-containing protein, partial [Thermomicrobiales bacterium]